MMNVVIAFSLFSSIYFGFTLSSHLEASNNFYENQSLHTSKQGINLIKFFEDLRLSSYPDPGTNSDPWTIGYGHTGHDVDRGMHITTKEAERLLMLDISKAEKQVLELVKVPLTKNQFSALVSFTFNCGGQALKKSELLEKLNRGKYEEAADEFSEWVHSNGHLMKGLVARRKMERLLFLGSKLPSHLS